MILKHIREYTIGFGSGGLVLMTDFGRYRETVGQFGISSVDEAFSILHAIEKIYLVDAKELPNVIENSDLNRMNQEELQTYINRRSDMDKSWLGKL